MENIQNKPVNDTNHTFFSTKEIKKRKEQPKLNSTTIALLTAGAFSTLGLLYLNRQNTPITPKESFSIVNPIFEALKIIGSLGILSSIAYCLKSISTNANAKIGLEKSNSDPILDPQKINALKEELKNNLSNLTLLKNNFELLKNEIGKSDDVKTKNNFNQTTQLDQLDLENISYPELLTLKTDLEKILKKEAEAFQSLENNYKNELLETINKLYSQDNVSKKIL